MTTLVTREGNKDTYCKDDPEWAGAEAKRRAATQAVRVWLVGGPGCSQRRQGNREDSHSRCRDGWQCLWKKPARAPCLPSASFPPSHPLPSPPSRPQREGINGCVDQSPAGRSISIYGERCVVPVVHPEQLSVLERSGNRQKGGCSIRSLTSVISDPRFVEPPSRSDVGDPSVVHPRYFGRRQGYGRVCVGYFWRGDLQLQNACCSPPPPVPGFGGEVVFSRPSFHGTTTLP
jgi:hypothetical protein